MRERALRVEARRFLERSGLAFAARAPGDPEGMPDFVIGEAGWSVALWLVAPGRHLTPAEHRALTLVRAAGRVVRIGRSRDELALAVHVHRELAAFRTELADMAGPGQARAA